MTGAPDAFDTDLNGPVFARYVRVGLEDKQRTDPAGGIEFYIGFREVEVFGRPTNEVGILSFTASANQVQAGQHVTLSWAVERCAAGGNPSRHRLGGRLHRHQRRGQPHA